MIISRFLLSSEEFVYPMHAVFIGISLNVHPAQSQPHGHYVYYVVLDVSLHEIANPNETTAEYDDMVCFSWIGCFTKQ